MASSTLTDLIHKTYGAVLVGALVSTFLSGMNTIQTVVYFRVYHEDPMRLKALVTAVWGLDIIHTGFLWAEMWDLLITNFGQPFAIDVIPKPVVVPCTIVTSVLLIWIVHMFYVHRIFSFSHRNYWITTPVFILILCEVACAIGAIVVLYRFQNFSVFLDSGYLWIYSLGYISAAVSDIVIMIILFILLRFNRQRSISLNKVIDQLIIYTFETGSLTAFWGIAMMITWLTEQKTDIYFSFYMSFPKVYATTLLGVLNARYYLRHNRGPQSSQGPNSTPIKFANLPTSVSLMQASEASTEIRHIQSDAAKTVRISDEENGARV